MSPHFFSSPFSSLFIPLTSKGRVPVVLLSGSLSKAGLPFLGVSPEQDPPLLLGLVTKSNSPPISAIARTNTAKENADL